MFKKCKQFWWAMACVLFFGFSGNRSENSPPKVTLAKPLNHGLFYWNTPLYYTIHVEDKEDGNTEFQEINPQEVFLRVVYYPQVKTSNERKNQDVYSQEESSLLLMSEKACFNCHSPENKIIGPSWRAVSEKYRGNTKAIGELAQKVIRGSSGVWGEEKMPSHPDMDVVEVDKLVRWILRYQENKDRRYFIGIEGAVSMGSNPHPGEKGFIELTASYTDHGLEGNPSTRRRGSETVVLWSGDGNKK